MKLLFLTTTFILACFSVVRCKPPNIVMFLTDDLDNQLGGLTPLTKTKEWIGDKGANFNNAFVVVPVCCPSRSSILTGLYQHNTRVTNNSVSGNCYGSYWREQIEKDNFGAVLQSEGGYNTFYAGKYLNRYGSDGDLTPPPGWTSWAGLVGNSRYYNYTLSINGEKEVHGDVYENDYLTDVIGKKADIFIEQYVAPDLDKPFLMVLATPAPHDPFTPAPQYKNRFANQTVPRTPAFNYVDGAEFNKHWFLRTDPKPLNETLVDQVDEVFRNRWRTLLSVDDLIDGVMRRLDELGELENTYVVFTSDHGYHMGTFALTIDKRMPYETDIRIPMMVRGPGISHDFRDEVVISIDLAPTMLDMAGLDLTDRNFDGQSFLSLFMQDKEEQSSMVSRDSFLVEYHGEGDCYVPKKCQEVSGRYGMCFCRLEWGCKCQDSGNNTYSCTRTLTEVENTMFCSFNDNENFLELYDLNQDPYQLYNMVSQVSPDVLQAYRDKTTALKM